MSLSVADLIALALIAVEVLRALRGRVRGGKLRVERAAKAIDDLRWMPLERFDRAPLLGRVWQLRDNLSAYDATFVAVAELSDAVVVTGDERLARSPGPR
jgi:predicted nucleic acid-binding protein